MRFIGDHETKVIARPSLTTFFTHERLHRGNDHGCIERGPFIAHFYLGDESCGALQLVHSLGDEFLTVSEDQGAPRLVVLSQAAEQDGLATSCREHTELAVEFLKALVDVLPSFHLIGTQAHGFRMGCFHDDVPLGVWC